MPMLERPDGEINYLTFGDGFPVLLFAPGGLRSSMGFWRSPPTGRRGRGWTGPRRCRRRDSPPSPWTSATPASRRPTSRPTTAGTPTRPTTWR